MHLPAGWAGPGSRANPGAVLDQVDPGARRPAPPRTGDQPDRRARFGLLNSCAASTPHRKPPSPEMRRSPTGRSWQCPGVAAARIGSASAHRDHPRRDPTPALLEPAVGAAARKTGRPTSWPPSAARYPREHVGSLRAVLRTGHRSQGDQGRAGPPRVRPAAVAQPAGPAGCRGRLPSWAAGWTSTVTPWRSALVTQQPAVLAAVPRASFSQDVAARHGPAPGRTRWPRCWSGCTWPASSGATSRCPTHSFRPR